MKWLVIKTTANNTRVSYTHLKNLKDSATFKVSDWDEIKSAASGYKVLLLIPTEQIVLSALDLPIKNKKQLNQAIPFAMEENLAEDIDDLHFVHHRVAATHTDTDEKTEPTLKVIAINKTRLQNWLEILADKGLKPSVILPDLFALPSKSKQWMISRDNDSPTDRTLVRQGAWQGFAAQPDLIPILLPAALENALPSPQSVQLSDYDLPDALAETLQNDEIELVETKALGDQCSPDINQALPFNLLNQFYIGDSSAIKERIAPWKMPVVMAVLAGISWFGYLVMQNQGLENRVKQLDQQLIQTFRDAMPKGRVDDDYSIMTSQMNAELKRLQGGGDKPRTSVLKALANASPELKKNKTVTLKKLHFKEQVLTLDMSSKALSELEDFSNAISRDGFKGSVNNATTSANRVDASVMIKEAN